MKFRFTALFVIFIICLTVGFYFINKSGKSKNQIKLPCTDCRGLPLRLMIPSINIDANIQHIGVMANGYMDVPDNIIDVGWFKLGPMPGEIGSAVIAGHFDGKNGEAGVFNNLYKLKKGDKVMIKDSKGSLTEFIVQGSREYNPGFAEEIFSSNDKAHLNLITCDGTWNGTKKSYSKRLVVFSDIATDSY